MKNKLQEFIENAGWPRVIIALFLCALFVAAPMLVGMSWPPGAAELVPAKQALSAAARASATPAARATDR